MDTDYQHIKFKDLTEKILDAFYKIYNKLGCGFLEKVYENAMMIELRKEGIRCSIILESSFIYVLCENLCPKL